MYRDVCNDTVTYMEYQGLKITLPTENMESINNLELTIIQNNSTTANTKIKFMVMLFIIYFVDTGMM